MLKNLLWEDQVIFEAMLKFIFSRTFILHSILALFLGSAVIGGAYLYLLNYTRQEATIQVPDLLEFDLYEAETILKDIELEGVVVDSLYLPQIRGGTIVDQEPRKGSSVKANRKIYLTIARYHAPMVRLPDILDQTLALAMAKLESYDVKVNELINKPGNCTDCVIAMEQNGKPLKPGTTIEKGTSIDLIVGEGATGERVSIPVLFGLDATEAQAILNKHGLNIGATPYVNCSTAEDSAMAKIYKQVPDPSIQKTTQGSSVDVYLTSDLSLIPPVNIDSLKAQLR